jgi:hypothetical protein
MGWAAVLAACTPGNARPTLPWPQQRSAVPRRRSAGVQSRADQLCSRARSSESGSSREIILVVSQSLPHGSVAVQRRLLSGEIHLHSTAVNPSPQRCCAARASEGASRRPLLYSYMRAAPSAVGFFIFVEADFSGDIHHALG